MCGISGILNTQQVVDVSRVEKMISAIDHRGPDDKKVFRHKQGIFGFTRLSIIDVDDRSMQPFVSKCNNYVLVFNGEIYNYIEIKKELKSIGVNFRTSGDAEVLLNAYIAWGENAFKKINGMYAFCITDYKRKKSFLVRDRFGQKPLFYFRKKEKTYFASEIKSFLNAGFKFESNNSAWMKYLVLGVSDDNEETFFKEVSQLIPGNYLEINFNGE